MYEFGENREDWPIAYDQDGFLTAMVAERKRIDAGISIHVWPNDHPPPHVHFIKKSEPDNQYVKINLVNGELEGYLPYWADKKQLRNIRALIIKYQDLFEGWWQKITETSSPSLGRPKLAILHKGR